MDKIICNQCGREAVAGAPFCVQCGARLGTSGAPSGGAITAAAPTMAPATSAGTYAPAARPASYGGFWIRFVAVIIDAVIVWAVIMPVSMIIGGAMGVASVFGRSASIGASLMAAFISMIFSVAGNWLYEALMESSAKQATLGKMIFGMKVTDLAGNRISFARASGRHFAKYLSGMILLIGYIMAGFTEKKQALHDMLAGTLVRRG